ncbi:MAG: hypothetical protein KF744_09100 [Taibaiella sp.]|nr:hypothetical protein [Taibaiella sp.]
MSGYAVSAGAVSRVVGYSVEAANFSEDTGNLPMRIAVFGEMNDDNQSTPVTPVQVTTVQEAGTLFGWGSPLQAAADIIFGPDGNRIAGIPVWFVPQLAASGAAANVQTITVTGTATANVTHTLLICGRRGKATGNYDINVVSGDTATAVAAKIVAAISAVLECPVTAENTAGEVTATAKWSGLTSQDIDIRVLTNGNTGGMSYAVAEVTAGSGTPSVAAGLTALGDTWNTLIVNTYGLVSSVITSFTNWNGNANAKTGQWAGIVMKPAIVVSGSTVDTTTSSSDTTVTEAQKAQMTLAVAPAPMSLGLPLEAASNMVVLEAVTAQDTPNIDCQGQSYPDMPLPADGDIPATASWAVRDAVVKKGMSTVLIVDGAYQVQDFVTTYHPDGEVPPSFRWVRDVLVDMNNKFSWYLLQDQVIRNKQIAADNAQVTAQKVVKPKDVKAAIAKWATGQEKKGLITDAKFTIQSARVEIPTDNPNRFNIFFSYKRSGVVRIVSTQVQAGFAS